MSASDEDGQLIYPSAHKGFRGQQDYNSVVKALDQGARGFIPKSAARKVILGAVQLVIRGGVYIPPLCPSLALPGPEQAPQRPVSPADLGLTERQMDVLTLIMHGKTKQAICRVLDLSEPTVKSHVSAILRAFRKRRDDGDLPEAPAPAVPPSPTRGLGPQGEAIRIVPEEP